MRFADFSDLSMREKEVLDLMTELYSAMKVAHKLNLSQKTISSHLERAKDKTGCEGMLQLVVEYDRWKWKVTRAGDK